MSRTRKGPGKVSDLSRCPTYPRFRMSCKSCDAQRKLKGYRNVELCKNQQYKMLYSIILLTKIIIFII